MKKSKLKGKTIYFKEKEIAEFENLMKVYEKDVSEHFGLIVSDYLKKIRERDGIPESIEITFPVAMQIRLDDLARQGKPVKAT